MSDQKLDPRVVEFCTRLEGLGPGEKARLRRNAGRTLAESHSVIGLFFRLLPPGVPHYHEEMYFLVATLFGLADGGGVGSFGDALFRARDPRREANPGLDRRIEVLLDADQDQLPFRLRQAVRFLHSRRVPVYWPRLLQDLLGWGHPRRYVQENWARAYFAGT